MSPVPPEDEPHSADAPGAPDDERPSAAKPGAKKPAAKKPASRKSAAKAGKKSKSKKKVPAKSAAGAGDELEEEFDDLDSDDEVDLDEELDEDLDDDEDSGEEDAGDSGDGAVPAAAQKKKAEVDPDEVLAHADTPVPKRAALLAALQKAFAEEIEVPEGLLERYAHHAELVLQGNRKMNLTAIVEPFDVAVKHYLDCWRTSRLLPLMGRSVLDIGTGAGYPGLPIAMAEPHTRVVCCDSTKKRVDFVQSTIEALGLKNAKAVWERAEEHLARNHYDVVIMRAISSVRENVRLLRKVKHSTKDVVMLKGKSWSREVRAAEREAERLGFRLDAVWEHALPEELGARAVLVYRAPGGRGRL